MSEEEKKVWEKKKNKQKKVIAIVALSLVLVIAIGLLLWTLNHDDEKNKADVDSNSVSSPYRIKGNDLDDFDLQFLKTAVANQNVVYSPLSIKYALAMLKEGANGASKEQIADVIGDYRAKKYTNSANLSLANALFVKDTYKENMKSKYTKNLNEKFNAEVIYDSFVSANPLNSWVKEKTLGLIDNLFDDVTEEDFILVSALAIDMEWVNKIQSEHEDWVINYPHEKYSAFVSPLDSSGYHQLEFNNTEKKAKAVEIGASVNRYDIVNVLGEESIRSTVGKEYDKWLAEGACGDPESEPDVNTYLDKYMQEINTGYQQISGSTDFLFYDDENVKVFAKDLKEYDGTTLQYVGIMPKVDSLASYIANIKAQDITTLIAGLKPLELSSFKDGVITKIVGQIPMFKADYEVKLIEELKKLGITDVFDSKKADLSNMTKDNAFIDSAVHKANMEFSNDGIKASAATSMFGRGAAGCGFEYLYDVPVEEIDLTFNQPYLFLVRDKSSGEVWFTGTVYEPTIWTSFEGN